MVETENIDPAQYCLLLAIHSKSFTNIWAQSSRHVPLNEQLHNQDYAHSYLEQLARKLNSAQVVDPERDGFFVELTFVKRLGRGGGNGGNLKIPGKRHGSKWPKRRNASCGSKTKTTSVLLPNIFWFFVFPFEPFLVSFALLSYSICGFRRGCTCLRMIYKQRNLLSFVLVSIVERAQETFSVLVNVSLC